MNELSSVEVSTVYSTTKSRTDEGRVNPYRRIVGLVGLGQELWTPSFSSGSPEYVDDAVSHETLLLPDSMGMRLLSFFDRYFCRSGLQVPDEPYNCHRFANWMLGAGDSMGPALTDVPDYVVFSEIEADRYLLLDQRGVIGKKDQDIREYARHSIIGLGEQVPECLQVTDIRGYLGIGSYAGVIADYHNVVSEAVLFAESV